MILVIIVAIWLGCGFVSLALLKKEKLPPTYKTLLVLEGMVGLLFIVFLKGGKNEK